MASVGSPKPAFRGSKVFVGTRLRTLVILGTVASVMAAGLVRWIMVNDGIIPYEQTNNVYMQGIPEDYVIEDPRVVSREKDFTLLRLPVGDNEIQYRFQGQRRSLHVDIGVDDDGFDFASLVSGRSGRSGR